MTRSIRILAPLAFAAAFAVSAGACNKDKNAGALSQDTTLNRDLALANKDSAAQPQLKDVPPADSSKTAAPAPTSSKAPERTRPRHRAPSSSTPSAAAPANGS